MRPSPTFPSRSNLRESIAAIALGAAVFFVGKASAATPDDSDEVIYQEPITVEGERTLFGRTDALEIAFETTTPLVDRGWRNLTSGTPNFRIAAGGAGSYGDSFSLRGLANTPYFGDPAVTVYLGDLALGSSFTYPASLASFTRASVARGPQGTRVGRAGIAGVVTLGSDEPGARPAAEIRAGAGESGGRTFALAARTARGRTADASLDLWRDEHDGFLENTLLGTRVDWRHATGGTARFRLRPSAGVEFGLQLFAQRTRAGAQPLVPLGGALFEVEREREGSTDIDSAGIAFSAGFDIGGARVRAVTNYTTWELSPYDSHIVLPPAIDSRVDQKQSTWSEEIRLSSMEDAPARWTAGVWLARTETEGDVFRELTDLFPIEGSSFDIDSRTAAVFGETGFALGSEWMLTTGARAETTRKRILRSEFIPSTGSYTSERDFDSVQAKLALSRQLSADTSAHISVATAAKPGGFSAFTANSALAPFDSERLLAFEAGVRIAPEGGAFRLDVSGFAWLVRDYQIERSFTATDYIVVDAPRARSLGGEAVAEWRPAPGWTVRGAIGVAVTTLQEFEDPFTQEEFSGNRAPFAPEGTASLEVNYRSASGWFASADAAFTGRTFFSESEDPFFAQGSYSVIGARAGYEGRGWRVAAYGTNLADTRYYSLIVPGVAHGVAGTPRMFGVELTLRL